MNQDFIDKFLPYDANGKKLRDVSETLKFDKNKILKSMKDVKVLAEFLEKYPTVKVLNLEFTKMGDDECKVLGAAISKSKGLQEGLVELTQNSSKNITGWKSLVTNVPTSLAFNVTQMVQVSVESVTLLVEILKNSSSIVCMNLQRDVSQNLELNGMMMAEQAFLTLIEALAEAKGLKKLKLQQNFYVSNKMEKIIVEGIINKSNQLFKSYYVDEKIENKNVKLVKTLTSFLPKCLTLSSLDLVNIQLTSEGIKNLMEALTVCLKLSDLSIKNCNSGDLFTPALASILPKVLMLQQLMMIENGIGHEGIAALIKVLPNCLSLTILGLFKNNITQMGLNSLITALPTFPQLTTLYLHENFYVDNPVRTILLNALFTCPALTRVDLSYTDNDIHGVCAENYYRCKDFLKAADTNNIDTINESFIKGASVWSRDQKLNTALHLSAAKGHLEIVRWLLKQNHALLNLQNENHKTALQLAQESSHQEVVNYLCDFRVPLKNQISPSLSSSHVPAPNSPHAVFSSASYKVSNITSNNNNNVAPIINMPISTMKPSPTASSEALFGEETDAMSIPKAQLVFENILGEGGFGQVHKGVWQHTKFYRTPVAIKQLKMTSFSEKLLGDFKREVKIQSELDCPYIVKLYGITAEQPYCMVMELMSNGTLRELLDNIPPDTLSWEKRLSMARDILQALVYLHSRQPPIIHGDLKSLNIMLADNFQAKITDFGLSTLKVQTMSHTNVSNTEKIKGSLLWMPPELLKGSIKKNVKTDIYSMGWVLWEMASHEFPYANAQGDESLIREWILNGVQEAFDERTPNTPPDYQNVVKKCWSQEPADRLTATQALNQLESISVFGKNPKAPVLFPVQTQESGNVALNPESIKKSGVNVKKMGSSNYLSISNKTPQKRWSKEFNVTKNPEKRLSLDLPLDKSPAKKGAVLPKNFLANQYVPGASPKKALPPPPPPEKQTKTANKITTPPAMGNRYY